MKKLFGLFKSKSKEETNYQQLDIDPANLTSIADKLKIPHEREQELHKIIKEVLADRTTAGIVEDGQIILNRAKPTNMNEVFFIVLHFGGHIYRLGEEIKTVKSLLPMLKSLDVAKLASEAFHNDNDDDNAPKRGRKKELLN